MTTTGSHRKDILTYEDHATRIKRDVWTSEKYIQRSTMVAHPGAPLFTQSVSTFFGMDGTRIDVGTSLTFGTHPAEVSAWMSKTGEGNEYLVLEIKTEKTSTLISFPNGMDPRSLIYAIEDSLSLAHSRAADREDPKEASDVL